MRKPPPSDSYDTADLPENSWRDTLIFETETIGQAILRLDESGLQVGLVVSLDERLIGTLTDGDIRRGLLRGADLSSPIDHVVNQNPLTVSPGVDRERVIQIMRNNDVQHVPVVNDGGHVVGLHTLKALTLPAPKSNLMVIMAGGRGHRLRPQTENCPKPMLHVAGKPMLEHILERAVADNFDQFVIAVGYLGEIIEEHFGDGSKWGVSITYLRESQPLGTAGALGLMSPRPHLPILVSNGDVLSDICLSDMLNFHVRNCATATMAVRQHEWQNPFGVVHINGVDIVRFEEKPVSRSYINAGVYVLQPEALDVVGNAEYCDMPTLFERLHDKKQKTIVFPMHEPWLDVGRPSDLALARQTHVPIDKSKRARKK